MKTKRSNDKIFKLRLGAGKTYVTPQGITVINGSVANQIILIRETRPSVDGQSSNFVEEENENSTGKK